MRVSKIRLQKCSLTLVNNCTSSRGHDNPTNRAAVIVECSRDHAPNRGSIQLYLFLRSEPGRWCIYMFFSLLLQAFLFFVIVLANKCCVRPCKGGVVRKAKQSNEDLVGCAGIKSSVETQKCSYDICGSVAFDPPCFSSGSIHDKIWESAISNTVICISNY